MADDHETTWTEFKEAVNMTASASETFLATGESHSVGPEYVGESG